jgi:hypothetical protein
LAHCIVCFGLFSQDTPSPPAAPSPEAPFRSKSPSIASSSKNSPGLNKNPSTHTSLKKPFSSSRGSKPGSLLAPTASTAAASKVHRSVKGLAGANNPSSGAAASAAVAGKGHVVVPKPHPSTAHTIQAAKAALNKAKGQSMGAEEDEGGMRGSMDSKPWNPYGKKDPALPKSKVEVRTETAIVLNASHQVPNVLVRLLQTISIKGH